jgi:hypothetical protein
MSLYVANLTKFNFQLQFWVEGVNKAVIVNFSPGEQKSVYPEGNDVDHQRIVDQHRVYGITPWAEVARQREFIGQCYQFDAPMPLNGMIEAMLKNEDVLNDQAHERRKEMAAASDDLMQKTAQETDTKINSFEVEIEEVEQKGVDPQIHEIISVGEDKPQQQERRRGRPRRS